MVLKRSTELTALRRRRKAAILRALPCDEPVSPISFRVRRKMKDRETDALLAAWAETIARRGPEGAVFDTRGEVSRTFSEIDAEADMSSGRLDFEPARVLAIQIGNHPAWPAIVARLFKASIGRAPARDKHGELRSGRPLWAYVMRRVWSPPIRAGEVEMTGWPRLRVEWGRNPPSLLKLTSGTTAAPRAIRFRSEQLLADCNQICDTMGITDRDLNFAVIPISHSYGFSNLLTPLLTRGVPLVLSHDRMPRAVLDDLACTNARVFPGMPVFYQAFCGMGAVPALPNLRLCISAGAPLPLAVAKKFRQKFQQPIHSFYGSSECGGICYDRAAPLRRAGFRGTTDAERASGILEPDAPMSTFVCKRPRPATAIFLSRTRKSSAPATSFRTTSWRRTADGFRIVGRDLRSDQRRGQEG